jgi:hypothetical protein
MPVDPGRELVLSQAGTLRNKMRMEYFNMDTDLSDDTGQISAVFPTFRRSLLSPPPKRRQYSRHPMVSSPENRMCTGVEPTESLKTYMECFVDYS